MQIAESNIQQIKCYHHNEQIKYVQMARVSNTGSRILCHKCKKNREAIPLQHFIQLCLDFQESINKPSSPIVQKLKNTYTQIIQQIQDLIQILNDKMQKSLFKAVQNDKEYLTKLLTNQKIYSLKDFETLAQQISENIEPEGFKYRIVENKIDDQKIAESNELCEFAQSLYNTMDKLFFDNNLIKKNINQNLQDKIKQDPFNIKLITNTKNFIADVQLNFDQTIIGARYAESMDCLLFWNFVDKWQFLGELQCFEKKLINFKFSKIANQIITNGADRVTLWEFDNFWIEKAVIYFSQNRLSCLAYNNSESMIAVGEGSKIILFEKNDEKFVFQQNLQNASEIITTQAFNYDDTMLAQGAADQSVILWEYKNEVQKFILVQKIQIYNTPKMINFSSVENEIFICTKDGLLHIFSYYQGSFKESQKIVNNINKIRCFALNQVSNILGVGGESNTLQLWRKNGNMWLLFEEIKQDDYIEAIVFGEKQRIIIATNNTSINVNYNVY